MSLGYLIVISLALGIGAWLAFLWSVRSGQYDDPEGPKYRMLDDDEPAPPPPAAASPPPGDASHSGPDADRVDKPGSPQ